MFPGEYTQPLVRKQFIQCAMISGYVGARLQAEDIGLNPLISGFGTTNAGTNFAVNTFVTYENVGNTQFSVYCQQTNDRSVSGTRTAVSTPVTMVAGGVLQQQFTVVQPFLEVFCNGSGPGELRMQLESQRQWRQLGFDKVDDATFYPTSLWQAKEQPGAVSSP